MQRVKKCCVPRLCLASVGLSIKFCHETDWQGVCGPRCHQQQQQQCENVARPHPACLRGRSARCPPHPPCEGMLQQRTLLINQPAHTYPALWAWNHRESCQSAEKGPSLRCAVRKDHKKIENFVWILDKWGSCEWTSGVPALHPAMTHCVWKDGTVNFTLAISFNFFFILV